MNDGRYIAERTVPRHGMRRTVALLAGASVAALLSHAPAAVAAACAAGAPPADVASPASLYEQVRARTNAQLLSIGFLNKPVADDCAWIYEVKVLMASGSVVELDFAAGSLDLVGARGPRDDSDAAALVRGFGADSTMLITGSQPSPDRASSTSNSDPNQNGSGDEGGDDGSDGGDGSSGDGGSGDGGSGEGGDSGEGGESGSSGSGSDDSGSDGSDGSDSGEGGSDGGGSSGSGSGDD